MNKHKNLLGFGNRRGLGRSQIDLNFSLFVPNRYYGAGNRGAGAGTGIFSIDATHNGDISSNNRHFYIPGLAFNHTLDEQPSLGVAVHGNGGQNTKFNGGTATFGQNLPLGLTGINALGGVLPALQSHWRPVLPVFARLDA